MKKPTPRLYLESTDNGPVAKEGMRQGFCAVFDEALKPTDERALRAGMRRSRIFLLLGTAIVLLGSLSIRHSRAQGEELDPVKLLPAYHKVVFENALVRVSEERMPPGVGIGKHRHMRGLTIGMAEYQMEQKMYPGGELVHSNRHLGEIHWTESMIHETRNVGKTDQYVVRVELKGSL
jgi:hypothetical protein